MQDSPQNAKDDLESGRSSEIREISGIDFPTLLKEITDPPARLFCRGNATLVSRKNKSADNNNASEEKTFPTFADFKYLCVVGARHATQYGVDACREIIKGLRGAPIVIVSGLARGIDAVAHEAALAAGLPTIAVLGSGLDNDSIYPRQNLGLAKEILASGGAIVSEYGKPHHPYPHDFPLRNRIMIGLSHAALVVEALPKSGTLITSKLATDYNRDVFAVPGSIFAPQSAGPHMLLSRGAMLATTSEDILHGLGLPAVESAPNPSINREFSVTANLSELERKILRALNEPMTRAELLQKIGGDFRETSTAISVLEIQKFITDSAGILRRK